MPTGKQICEKQLLKVIDDLEKVKSERGGNRRLYDRHLPQAGLVEQRGSD